MINVERIWWSKLILMKVWWNAGAMFESEIVVAKHKMQIQKCKCAKRCNWNEVANAKKYCKTTKCFLKLSQKKSFRFRVLPQFIVCIPLQETRKCVGWVLDDMYPDPNPGVRTIHYPTWMDGWMMFLSCPLRQFPRKCGVSPVWKP